MHKRLLVLLGGCALLSACGMSTIHEHYGAVEITATAPDLTKDTTTSDGWTVTYDRFLVSMTAITVASTESQVVTQSSTAQLFDAVQTSPPVSLLLGLTRFAQPWDNVNFEIGPAATSDAAPITLTNTISDADSAMMTMKGYSIFVAAKAKKGTVTKTINWGFTTDTTFSDCGQMQGGTLVKGLVIPENDTVTVNLAFQGSVLFSDDLANPGKTLRFAAIAAADADNNGEVTVDELTATTLSTAKQAGGPYGVGMQSTVADLGAFTAALTQQLLATYGAGGSCTPAPAMTAAAAAP